MKMWPLKHLNYERCPICGAEVQGLYVSSTHCSGEQFEHVKFKCGAKIKYVPNFKREEIETQCSKHPDEVEKLVRDKEALESILKRVNKSALSAHRKEGLRRHIEFLIPKEW